MAVAAGAGGSEGEERQLVHEARDLVGGHVGRNELRRLHLHIPDPLTGDLAPVEDGHPCTHPLEDVEQAGAARVEAHVVDGQIRAGEERRGDDEWGGRGEVAGYLDLAEMERGGGLDGGGARATTQGRGGRGGEWGCG